MSQTREFKGRVVTPGTVSAEALVSHGGLNTLASFQKALQFGDKTATCGDQNNPDLYGKQMLGKALCLPQTIGSTTGGLVLYCACAMERQPACMLFSKPIDSLAAAGAILADVWVDNVKMPVVDCLGDEFLDYVKDLEKATYISQSSIMYSGTSMVVDANGNSVSGGEITYKDSTKVDATITITFYSVKPISENTEAAE